VPGGATKVWVAYTSLFVSRAATRRVAAARAAVPSCPFLAVVPSRDPGHMLVLRVACSEPFGAVLSGGLARYHPRQSPDCGGDAQDRPDRERRRLGREVPAPRHSRGRWGGVSDAVAATKARSRPSLVALRSALRASQSPLRPACRKPAGGHRASSVVARSVTDRLGRSDAGRLKDAESRVCLLPTALVGGELFRPSLPGS
jgi:hypothetical protein